MSLVSETIVREYFESLGFLVRQPRKYAVAARAKRADEEIDLLVFNPRVTDHVVPESLQWGSAELSSISRAIIGIRGWHTDRFSPAVIETSPEIFRFAEEESVRRVRREFGEGPIAKILCLPGLSATDELKKRSISILKDRGIDGVLSFRTMLFDLINMVETSRNYEKSDLLQVLRILKNYGLVGEPQLDFFRASKRKRPQPAMEVGDV